MISETRKLSDKYPVFAQDIDLFFGIRTLNLASIMDLF